MRLRGQRAGKGATARTHTTCRKMTRSRRPRAADHCAVSSSTTFTGTPFTPRSCCLEPRAHSRTDMARTDAGARAGKVGDGGDHGRAANGRSTTPSPRESQPRRATAARTSKLPASNTVSACGPSASTMRLAMRGPTPCTHPPAHTHTKIHTRTHTHPHTHAHTHSHTHTLTHTQ